MKIKTGEGHGKEDRLAFYYSYVVLFFRFGDMSASSYNSYTDNLPKDAYATVPANSSKIIADSRFRELDNEFNSPANFEVRTNGAITGKVLQYNNLVWKQPLYSHNLESCELKFQLRKPNTDCLPSPVMTCYAMPFVMYNSFDGNKPGSLYAAPQGESYAAQMEYALNHDVRFGDTELEFPPPSPYVEVFSGNENNIYMPTYFDSDTEGSETAWGKPCFTYAANPAIIPIDGFKNQATIYFRYSSTRGFAMWAVTEEEPNLLLELKILDCDWVRNGHFVHGFGSYDIEKKKYVPVDSFVPVYYAESLPTLLPTRYVVVKSDELTKDRRIQSYGSAENPSILKSEIAILPIKTGVCGQLRTVEAGNDATTVSFLDTYDPQFFRIAMTDERGKVFECGNPLAEFINNGDADVPESAVHLKNTIKLEFVSGEFGGTRASWRAMNYILFGPPNTKLWQNWVYIYFEAYGFDNTLADHEDYNSISEYYADVKNKKNYSYGSITSDMLKSDIIHSMTSFLDVK